MKKLICTLLAFVMVMVLPMTVLASGTTVDYVVVAGEEALCSSNWSSSDRNNEMTLSGTDYVKVYEDVPAGSYQFKVVVNYTDGTPDWIGDPTGNNVGFTVTATCDVTVTYDPATGTVEATGANVVETTLEVERIVAVGNGSGNWLNGANWDTAATANNMTEISDGVYQITYADVPAGNYAVKFAANGSWSDSWGGSSVGNGMESEAVYNGRDIPISLAEPANITLTLDLTGFDYASKSGATFTVTIGEAAVEPAPIEAVEITDVDVPAFGANADWDFSIPADAGYVIYVDDDGDDCAWTKTEAKAESIDDINDGHWYYEHYNAEDGYTFGEGYYSFSCALMPEDGYAFTEDTTATINGKEAWVEIYEDLLIVYMVYDKVTDAPALTPIESVEVNDVTVPAIGEDASWDFTTPSGADYVPAVDVDGGNGGWFVVEGPVTDPTNYESLIDSVLYLEEDGPLTFEVGKTYCFMAVLDANDGYVFTEETVAMLNGNEAQIIVIDGQAGVYYLFDMLEEETVIESVEITGVTAPAFGANADWEFSVPADAGYMPYEDADGDDCGWAKTEAKPENLDEIYEGDWYYENYPEDATGIYTFEEGYYSFICWLEAEDGYVFTEDTTATINGQEAWVDYDEGYLYVYMAYDEVTEQEEEPIPGTGDMNMAALVVALLAATAGAIVIGKKKEF